MKKNLIALAVAATMVPAIAAAEGASISGFNDITLMSDNDATVFGANTEIDFRSTQGAVTVGADVDFTLGTNASTGNSATLEQAFFAWAAAENVTVIAGLFNNPIGLEGEDAPDMATMQTTMSYNTLDAVTAADGNNIAGLAVAYNAGVATITAALINNNAANDDADTFALVVNASPMEGLDLELGYLSEGGDNANVPKLGSITTDGSALNLNATFTTGPIKASVEYMTADVFTDDIIGLTGVFTVNDATSVAARYEVQGDANQASAVVWYNLADNLIVGAGFNSTESAAGVTDDSAGLEFIASF